MIPRLLSLSFFPSPPPLAFDLFFTEPCLESGSTESAQQGLVTEPHGFKDLGTKTHASLRPKLPRSSRTIESRAKTAPLRATSPREQRDERRARAAGSEASRGSRWPRWRCVDSVSLVLSCGPREEQVSLTALRPRGKAAMGEGRWAEGRLRADDW